jgi:dihydroorotate dehydrogenase electron transfer subunit
MTSSATTNPLHAAYYADRAVSVTGTILENVELARDTFRVRIAAPEIARRIVPGQFLMLRIAGYDDPLLGRPLALYDTVLDKAGQPYAVDVVYLVVGKLTSKLARLRSGTAIELWGPLGNGFSPMPVEHLVMVAGGIGQTPFVALGAEALGRRTYGDLEPNRPAGYAQRVTFCYGARTAAYLAGVEDFRAREIDVRISTDDGTAGHHGLVTDLLREVLAHESANRLRVVCCGPERMMEAVAEICIAGGVACEVSLETPMACGIGICFSCVAKVLQADGTWDYKRTCVEGPIFAAEKLVW